MNKSNHYLAGVLAFVIWGFFSIPLRALIVYPVGEILYFRILFSSIILSIILIFFRKGKSSEAIQSFKDLTARKKLRIMLLTLGGSLLLTVNWLAFIYTVNNINIKTASFSYLICPVLTAILGSILLKEFLSKWQWLAVVLCGMSCMLMGLNSVKELNYSLFVAFTYALYLVTQRMNQGADRLLTLGIQVFFSLLLLSLFFNDLVPEIPLALDFYLITGCIALVFTVIPLFLNLYALNKINAASIGIMMYINPILNFIVAIVFFNEKVSIIQWLGYGIILVALLIFNNAVLIRNVNAKFSD